MGYKSADIDASIAGKSKVRAGMPFFTPQSGENGKWRRNRVRILPPSDTKADGMFYEWAALHNNLGDVRQFICPRKMNDESCPACEEADSLRRQGLKDDAKELYPNWRSVVNVVVMTADGEVALEDSEPRVLIWSLSKGFFEELLDALKQLPEDERDITDPKHGRDLIFRRKGKGSHDTRYEWIKDPNDDEKIVFPEVSALPKTVIKMLEGDALHDLSDVFQRITTQKISGLLSAPAHTDPFEDGPTEGVYREIEEDEDESETPVPTVRTRGTETGRRTEGSAVTVARERLQAKLQSTAVVIESDEEDEEEDE